MKILRTNQEWKEKWNEDVRNDQKINIAARSQVIKDTSFDCTVHQIGCLHPLSQHVNPGIKEKNIIM